MAPPDKSLQFFVLPYPFSSTSPPLALPDKVGFVLCEGVKFAAPGRREPQPISTHITHGTGEICLNKIPLGLEI